jgi:hypothetical protein
MQVFPSKVMQRMTPLSLNLTGYVVVVVVVVAGHSQEPTAQLVGPSQRGNPQWAPSSMGNGS